MVLSDYQEHILDLGDFYFSEFYFRFGHNNLYPKLSVVYLNYTYIKSHISYELLNVELKCQMRITDHLMFLLVFIQYIKIRQPYFVDKTVFVFL